MKINKKLSDNVSIFTNILLYVIKNHIFSSYTLHFSCYLRISNIQCHFYYFIYISSPRVNNISFVKKKLWCKKKQTLLIYIYSQHLYILFIGCYNLSFFLYNSINFVQKLAFQQFLEQSQKWSNKFRNLIIRFTKNPPLH